MLEMNDLSKCCGCGACEQICPQHCITMESNEEGFVYPVTDQSNCTDCRLCETVCPIGPAENDRDRTGSPDAYAAYTKNREIHRNSSSGGLFYEIAAFVIENGGVVFGAAFSDGHMVEHIGVDTLEDVRLLQGSKYVQSNMGSCYSRVRQILSAGRLVLFTGTPCQVAGLKKFLRRDYDHLITQDIICHGVPSPMVWRKYICKVEADSNSSVSEVHFRDKKLGWSRYSVRFGLTNGREQRKVFSEDPFMKGFLQNIYLRPSCHQCSFKTIHRDSDFTLADFWGIQHVCDKMIHTDGTSLVWINTEKAERIWEKIRGNLRYEPVDLHQAIKYNSAAVSSVAKSQNRERFFEMLKNNSFEYALNAALPKVSMLESVLKKLKKCLKRINMSIFCRAE